MEKSKTNDTSLIENRFFTLDFTKKNADITEVKTHFYTTFPHDDPTEGNVVYDRLKWQHKDIIQLKNGDGLYLYLKKRENDPNFDSFRLISKAFYNLNDQTDGILFVFKGKLPSARGIWPAWWLNGSRQEPWLYKGMDSMPSEDDLDTYSGKGRFYNTQIAVNATDWPAAGEIDIIETINGDNIIHNTLHTCPQMCDSEWNNDGQIVNCANARPGDLNAGCSGKPYETEGSEGTFACLWQKDTITFYYWDPQADIRFAGGPLSDNPTPNLWPAAAIKNQVKLHETNAECDTYLHNKWQCASCATSTSCLFVNMKMMFNATLCGKWAGNRFDESGQALQNCQAFIAGEGSDKIHNQFMKIEYVSVKKIQNEVRKSLEMGQTIKKQQPFVKRQFEPYLNGKWIGNAVAYGFYRKGQAPGVLGPSKAEILEDLQILMLYWQLIRVYNADDDTERILQVIHENKLPIKMMLGIWLENEEKNPELKVMNTTNVMRGIELANRYANIVIAVNIGNESQVDWSWHKMNIENQIRYVRAMRSTIIQPVTVADDFNFWNKPHSAKMASEVDFIVTHIYPLWNGKTLDIAISWMDSTFRDVQQRHAGMQIVLGEIGWATIYNPDKNGPGEQGSLIKGEVSLNAQEKYLIMHNEWVNKNKIPTFLFEAFDEPWKGGGDNTGPTEVEKNWGVFYENRTPKASFQNYLKAVKDK